MFHLIGTLLKTIGVQNIPCHIVWYPPSMQSWDARVLIWQYGYYELSERVVVLYFPLQNSNNGTELYLSTGETTNIINIIKIHSSSSIGEIISCRWLKILYTLISIVRCKLLNHSSGIKSCLCLLDISLDKTVHLVPNDTIFENMFNNSSCHHIWYPPSMQSWDARVLIWHNDFKTKISISKILYKRTYQTFKYKRCSYKISLLWNYLAT